MRRRCLIAFTILLTFLLIFTPFPFLILPTKAQSTINTSPTEFAIGYPTQRKSFHANGRFWAFYSDGTNMVYCTSTDGSTWTAPTAIRPADLGDEFSIWFDGTYFHYACAPGGAGTPIYYRKGLPVGDGSITWVTDAEQTVIY